MLLISKMVDSLPLKLFSLKYLKITLEKQRYDPFIALLPSTLSNLAMFKPCHSWSQGLHFLSLAVAVVAFDSFSRELYSALKKQGKAGTAMTLWTAEFRTKIIVMASVTWLYISERNERNLGSLELTSRNTFSGSIRAFPGG
jgi:hypothetical protein